MQPRLPVKIYELVGAAHESCRQLLGFEAYVRFEIMRHRITPFDCSEVETVAVMGPVAQLVRAGDS